MTTYTKLRNLAATLRETKAELENLAAVNTGDQRGVSFFSEAAEKIDHVIKTLEERLQFIVQEEPQFEDRSAAENANAQGEEK